MREHIWKCCLCIQRQLVSVLVHTIFCFNTVHNKIVYPLWTKIGKMFKLVNHLVTKCWTLVKNVEHLWKMLNIYINVQCSTFFDVSTFELKSWNKHLQAITKFVMATVSTLCVWVCDKFLATRDQQDQDFSSRPRLPKPKSQQRDRDYEFYSLSRHRIF